MLLFSFVCLCNIHTVCILDASWLVVCSLGILQGTAHPVLYELCACLVFASNVFFLVPAACSLEKMRSCNRETFLCSSLIPSIRIVPYLIFSCKECWVSGNFQHLCYTIRLHFPISMKILIVEDEHKIANSIKKGLEQEHFVSDIAYDGERGLDLALSEDYDLVILDRLLPEIDGIEICKRIRAGGVHTPILLLTARGQLSDKVEGLNAGADDYLVKPFAFEELLARVRALLRRPKKTVNPVLKIEDLVIDASSYEVKRADRNIFLTQKEFMLLEYLARHANKILTKDQIINHVWDYEANILPNTVEAYIMHLRNKIDKPFTGKTPLIHTARGFGYMIGVRN